MKSKDENLKIFFLAHDIMSFAIYLNLNTSCAGPQAITKVQFSTFNHKIG
jgi:hypothetical protein